MFNFLYFSLLEPVKEKNLEFFEKNNNEKILIDIKG